MWLCTDFLFTCKSDTGMSEIKSIDGLYHALGDSGLLTDYRSDRTKVILYLQALIDEAQVYMDTYPKVEEGTLSERAVLSLAQIRDLRDTDPEGVVDKNDRYYYARRFSEGIKKLKTLFYHVFSFRWGRWDPTPMYPTKSLYFRHFSGMGRVTSNKNVIKHKS